MTASARLSLYEATMLIVGEGVNDLAEDEASTEQIARIIDEESDDGETIDAAGLGRVRRRTQTTPKRGDVNPAHITSADLAQALNDGATIDWPSATVTIDGVDHPIDLDACADYSTGDLADTVALHSGAVAECQAGVWLPVEPSRTQRVQQALLTVERRARAATQQAALAEHALDARDEAIREAHRRGARVTDLAQAADLHRVHVHRIIRDG